MKKNKQTADKQGPCKGLSDFAAAISAATLYDRTVGSAVSQQGGKRERQTGGIFFLLASEQEVCPHVTSADDEASQWPRTGRRRGPALDSEWK